MIRVRYNPNAAIFLPIQLGVDGLLGLNFLRRFNLTLNFEVGILTVEVFA